MGHAVHAVESAAPAIEEK
jgi:hypothetical protein